MDNKVNKQIEKSTLSELLQLVTFHLCDEEFAVDILNIQGINRMVQVTKVPNSPDFVEGIINLRGQVIPIIDLRKRIGMPPKEYDKHTRFIVVEIQKIVIGFIVDSVNEVLRIDRGVTEPPPTVVGNIENEFITAIAKLEDRLITLLDLDKILSNDEKMSLEKAA
ncbi:MAG: chemotaxis protein CheW [FCB group bacterium]|jgi:purine-binding chemotaxis protein CheW